jgi:multidrug efflux pump subunit AcrA (membrane-fusion protein)
MKRVLIILGIVVAVTALVIFNNIISSKKNTVNTYAEVKKGLFEIVVSNSGELLAEKSIEIKGPVMGQATDDHGQSQGGQRGGGGGGGGGRGGGGGGGGGGGDMHAMDLKIQDIVPEGTIVKEGDYIAQLDRSSYDNTLKDEMQNLQTLQTALDMKILDTAVVLTNLRDDIKNQKFVVEEARIVLDQSKYEPPATQRQAEMNVNKAQRNLEQKKRTYTLVVAQNLSAIENQKMIIDSRTRRVTDIQNFLAKFTVTAPSSGMVIYKKDRNGTKRKEGSSINSFDGVVATLPDLTSMISKIYVNEIEISKVKKDQPVDIVVDAFPKKAYTGKVFYIANVGEVLPNSDAKMFEVQIKVDGSDPDVRPAMTTSNKIHIKTFNDVIFIPIECVQTGTDSIPFVYQRNRTRHIVVLAEANDKNIIVKQGLEPGVSVYLIPPTNPERFKLIGEDLIPVIKGKTKI